MGALSTYKKELRKCPVCESQFREEFMLTGSMRQVSINMNEELRTFYKEYQEMPVVPFIYETLTCPKCLFSSLIPDFNNLYVQKQNYSDKELESIKNLRISIIKEQNRRRELINSIDNIDFENPKNLETALASYILSVECYGYFSEKLLPDTKRAVCSLRAAWLASDIDAEDLKNKYYREAQKYYSLIANRLDDSGGFKLGLDWGNNFGFEGVRYIKAALDMRLLDDTDDIRKKFDILQNARATFSKIRGFGKASQNKRGPLLKIAEDMFERIQPIYEKIKAKVEAGDYEITDDLKVDTHLNVSANQQESTDSTAAPDLDTAAIEPKPEEKVDNYNIAATEIVKYCMRSGVKRDSIKDIEKILRKYFEN